MVDAAEAVPDWAHELSADEWDEPDDDEEAERLPHRGRRHRRGWQECR